MIVKDLSGISHNLKLGNVNINSKRSVKSNLHIKARELLKEIYPFINYLTVTKIKSNLDYQHKQACAMTCATVHKYTMTKTCNDL